MLARDEQLQEQLEQSEWDLVVVDEAHRMSARFTGRELVTTKRYQLGKRVGQAHPQPAADDRYPSLR